MQPLPKTKNCFVCGTENASGLRLQMRGDGKCVRAAFIPRPEHAGFTHAVHGGITATVLDEIMAWAIIDSTRRAAYSAEFTIRYQRPIRVGETTEAMGEVTVNRRNKLFETRGEIRNAQGEICAVATGKYMALRDADMESALMDFPAEARGYFTPSS
ncbi:MAG: PaaI family thioesterase [Verrucomicrobia bacterium]|nr:PaaI family thioesterase [Verrucomicrobiota bacterium]MBI3866975.1 PaaI family thioesterase [Verrucomicrobiota bacterium]